MAETETAARDDGDTAARARTRRAIVAAAIEVLAGDGGASLSEVAAAAQVSRTTVHRYFAERSDLIAAVADEAIAQVTAATRRACLDRGPAPKALARLCREYFELGSVLTILFNGVVDITEQDWARCETDSDRELAATVARGREEGSIAPDLTDAWIVQLVWTLLYTAWTYVREQDVPRQEGLELCLRSLRKAVAA
ncbi:MAG: TetR/AcrR family transcriptional regulator [Solirubrobacteraceae bacterium]|nr:TetR/AcrR family transcriptional regulator [Solirubrobacteraceae bacterium]